MLNEVSNKKNILILSGLISHKVFANTSKSGKSYVQFLLAQQSNDTSFRYFKVYGFDEKVIKYVANLSKQTIVEITGHLSLSKLEKELTYLLVCDNIVPVVEYNMPLKSKGGLNIEDYNNVAKPITVSNLDKELDLLEQQARKKNLK
jgi:primosomal replication protein N